MSLDPMHALDPSVHSVLQGLVSPSSTTIAPSSLPSAPPRFRLPPLTLHRSFPLLPLPGLAGCFQGLAAPLLGGPCRTRSG